MATTIQLLERARKLVPRQSRTSLGIALGIDTANLRRIYRARAYLNPVQCERLAKLLEMDPLEVIRIVSREKTRNRPHKHERATLVRV